MKCSAFWNHTNIRSGNRVYPCCRFKRSIATFDGDIDNVLHSTAYQDLREQSAKGEFIKGCEKCFYEEKIGHKSLREEFNEKYSMDKVELKFLEIGFDNLCNLTCDGCNSEFSTSWIVKEKEIYGAPKHKLMEIDEVTNVPDSLEKILFLGGEPLITNRHLKLLHQVKNKSNLEVIYNTYGTFIPNDEVVQELRHYKKVTFILCIDGVGELGEAVRGGTKWPDVVKFIDWVHDNMYTLEFNSVLHKNNYMGLKDLHDFCTRFTNTRWYINVLTFPFDLDINVLDADAKNSIISDARSLNLPNKDFIINHLQKN